MVGRCFMRSVKATGFSFQIGKRLASLFEIEEESFDGLVAGTDLELAGIFGVTCVA